MLRQSWWKILSFLLLIYVFIAGFLNDVPSLPNVEESIRNLYFHVAMWFCMMIFFIISVVNAIKYLRTRQIKYDFYSVEYAQTGIVFGLLGLVTGMIWANFTWGKAWSNDPKQLGAAIALLIYLAYLVLRSSLNDDVRRAKTSAVYNIFAFVMLFPTIWILPRFAESLHPGGVATEGTSAQGNPGLNPGDLDWRMRAVFYPAVIGWTLLGVWITTLRIRVRQLVEKKLNS